MPKHFIPTFRKAVPWNYQWYFGISLLVYSLLECSQEPSTCAIIGQVSPIHTTQHYHPCIEFNNVNSKASETSRWSLSFSLSHQKLKCILLQTTLILHALPISYSLHVPLKLYSVFQNELWNFESLVQLLRGHILVQCFELSQSIQKQRVLPGIAMVRCYFHWKWGRRPNCA
jgi:hypothetical protein